MYPLATVLFPVMWSLSHDRTTAALPISACTVLGLQMLIRRAGDFSMTLLDTIVLDAIPGPEYLAMANSATFASAVSMRWV
jgi:HD-like signal output (HDOD) protein